MSSNPGLGDTLQGVEGILFLVEDSYILLSTVLDQGLAELEPDNVAVQIGRPNRGLPPKLWGRHLNHSGGTPII